MARHDAMTVNRVCGSGAQAIASAAQEISLGHSDVAIGMRVFHTKFGYGEIAEIEGNKLEIEFETAGRKRVLDSFVTVG